MITLGITGGIGSGKSTVSDIFSLYGVPVYIADKESKRLVDTSLVIRQKLIGAFGEDLYKNGILDKTLLASYIFNDKTKLELVNAVIHPVVETDFINWKKNNQQYKIIAQEAAILFESGFNKLVDKVLTVYTPLELRIERTMVRDNSTRERVLERINNQMPDEEKIKLSDFVIVNDGRQSLIEQVLRVIQELENA